MTLVPWLTWVVPLVGAVLVPGVERLGKRFCAWFAIAVCGISALFSLGQALTFTSSYVENLGWSIYRGVEAEVNVDGLSVLLALFVSALSLVILVYAAGIMSGEEGQGRFYSLMLAFIGSMVGLVMSGNLVQFYLLWELLGICSALLIAFWWDREPARKAGLKAFLFTRVGDVALLVAVLLILASLGTTDIATVLRSVGSPGSGPDWTLVGFLLLVGAMGKSAQVPLHVWLPDAMEGPTPVSALIHAATMVNAGVYLLVRLYPVVSSSALLSNAVLLVGLVSMLVGGACATAATDIKRVLAYSTISQLGLMFAAIGLGSLAGAVYTLVAQGIFKALAFMGAGAVSETTGTRDLTKMGGLRSQMKVTYLGFLVAALAMAGFPPFFGFWTKEVVASSALASGPLVFAVLLIGLGLTAFYSFRLVFRAFHGSPVNSGAKEPGALMLGPVAVLMAVTTVGWLGVAYQGLFSPALSLLPEVSTVVASVGVAVAVTIMAYEAYAVRSKAAMYFAENGAVSRWAGYLGSGLRFDSAYSAAYRRAIVPLARLTSRIQTGDLGDNSVLLLAALGATLLLVVVLA